jgi:carbon monoxide dehydrogenase subunit G
VLLTNEFVVAADVERVWAHLLDLENVAACVPGARVEEVVPPATYKGTIRLKIGPLTVEYRGQATLVEADESAHRATIEMKAREARGQGSAVATVRNHLEQVDGGTRVVAETDLQITGPQAQFGKGVLEDVGGRILEEFSARLERQISGGDQGVAAGTGAGEPGAVDGAHAGPAGAARAAAGGGSDSSADALDLNRVLAASMRTRAKRVAVPLAALAAAVLAVLAALRRRRAGRRRIGRRGG